MNDFLQVALFAALREPAYGICLSGNSGCDKKRRQGLFQPCLIAGCTYQPAVICSNN